MLFRKGLLAGLGLMFTISVSAQFDRYNAEVFVDSEKLDLALVGGLIAPQFSEVDLNNDGIQDLFVFDRAGNVVLTFLNNGTPNEIDYVYAPYYERFFPEMRAWAMLRDYNGDGIMDIFAYSDFPGVQGAIVYTGKYVANTIQFDRFSFAHKIESNVIPYFINGYTQLYITDQDYPAVDDIDGDGDLDILTFAIGGGYVEMYENQSVEMGYGLDSLIFDFTENCWGKFYESGTTEEIALSSNMDECSDGFHGTDVDYRHAGSTLLTLDNDADGDKDLILGDLSFTNLNLLTNGGSTASAYMTAQEIFFPEETTSADIDIFPASFYIDLNNDGVKDLLGSPNNYRAGENHEVVWRYTNTGATDQPVFEFEETDFLVGEMIDMGFEAHPTFVDYNADGLLDLVVGNQSFYLPFGERKVRLELYENIGTANTPKFELVDEDYLNFSNFDGTANNAPAPTFGDIDSDGDMDVLIGETSGGFFFGENVAGPGNEIDIPSIQFGYFGLDMGAFSRPQFVDLNRDGLLDIVAGEKVGRFVYFQNEGTATEPVFIPNITTNEAAGNNIITLGLVDTQFELDVSGYASPFIYDFDEEYVLFSGSERGHIYKFSNIDGNLDGTFTVDDNFYGEVRPGFLTAPVIIDINNDDRLEMFVGNVRGGITAYKTNLRTDGTIVNTEEVIPTFSFDLYPNPSDAMVNLVFDFPMEEELPITVYNAVGQIVYKGLSNDPTTRISTENWASGLFIVQVEVNGERLIQKLIKK